MEVRGKNVLVTGATSGIGEDIAVHFAQAGANVAINYRTEKHKSSETEERIKQLCTDVRACDVQDLPVQADVSDASDIDNMFQRVLAEWDGLDVLVNNAGIQIESNSHEMSVEEFDKVLAVNLRGAFLCCQAAIRHFLEAGKEGHIINISSVHETIPKPRYIGYSISKGGMRNLTRTLALEYADRNVHINAVAPGAIVTPINRSWINDPDKKQAVEERIPMQRAGNSAEIAAVVVFLVSDAASYVTGQTLFADGGLTLNPGFREDWTS